MQKNKNKKILSSKSDIQSYLGVGIAAFRRLMAAGLPCVRLPESNIFLAHTDNLDEFIRRLTAKQNKINLEEITDDKD